MRVKKNIKIAGLAPLVLLLAACGRGEVTAQSTSGWDQMVYLFARAIQWLSFDGSIGVGIILFYPHHSSLAHAFVQHANQIKSEDARHPA